MSNPGEEKEMSTAPDQTANSTKLHKSERTPRTETRGVRLSGAKHPDVDTASQHSDSSPGSRRSSTNYNGRDDQTSAQYEDNDRDELLRKIDELQEQLRRSGNMSEKSDQASPFLLTPGRHIPAPPQFLHHHREPFHHGFGHQMPMPGVYNPCSVHDHRAFPPPFPVQYPHQSPQPYLSGSNIPFDVYHQNAIFPQAPCTCLQCFEKLQRSPAPAPCNVCFGDLRYSHVSCQHDNPGGLSPPMSRFQATSFAPPETAYGPSQTQHTRWPSDMDSVMSGFAPRASPKFISDSSVRHILPVAGGAPFFTCHNCFELLRVPSRRKLTATQLQKLKCGACSVFTSFSLVNNKLLISFDAEPEPVWNQIDDGSMPVTIDTAPESYGHGNHSSNNFSSVDYDRSGYSIDREGNSNRSVYSNKIWEAQSIHSSGTPRDKNDSWLQNSHPNQGIGFQQEHGQSLEQLFERSTADRKLLLDGMAYITGKTEKTETQIEAQRRTMSKVSATISEREISFNESSNTEVSLDSSSTVRDSERAVAGREEERICDTIEESSEDETQENDESTVSVNGQPINRRLVKAAEKMAGPIQPGNYWYDYRAGFWGVMGGPCLGIILPFIEEFNHPMPKNCAAGNTGVFVNGRELHRKDLVLLASRGLPTEKNRHYIIDISGRVLDGEAGEELDCLGRLAPTVEKLKRGFGMKLPRVPVQTFQPLNITPKSP